MRAECRAALAPGGGAEGTDGADDDWAEAIVEELRPEDDNAKLLREKDILISRVKIMFFISIFSWILFPVGNDKFVL